MPKGRILAVDDQRYFRELIEGLLVDEGYEAQTASSGEEALRVLENADFDIVVTDLVMPGMDGSELVHRIKERDPDQDVVVVTGVVDVKTAVDAMKLGARDYLLKPFDRETLALALENIRKQKALRADHERLLAENIEYLGERSLFERALGLFSCLSLDPLTERIVEGLCVETRAQAGVLWIASAGDAERLDLRAARGLVRLDAEPICLAVEGLAPELRNGAARSLLVSAEGSDRRALHLPLRHDGALIGLVRLTDKLGGDPFDGVDRACAEKFGQFAESALDNALRFRSLERRSLADPRSGAYTTDYFEDVARNEIEKASRFGRSFSLLRVDLGPLDRLGETRGEIGLQEWIEGVVGRMRPLLRSSDLLAAQAPAVFHVLLPEAGALGAATLKRRMADDLRESDWFRHLEEDERPEIHMAAVTYPGDGTQLESLLRVLGQRLAGERDSLVRRLELASQPFDEALRSLLAQGGEERPETADQIARFVLGEVARRPRERGLCFVAPGVGLSVAVREGLESLRGSEIGTDVVVLAKGDKPAFADAGITWLSPRALEDVPPFLLHFGDGPAYAMVRSADDESGGTRLFHSDDRNLVEHLAFRLQADLALGPVGVAHDPAEVAA